MRQQLTFCQVSQGVFARIVRIRVFIKTLYYSQAAQAHDMRSYYCFNRYANVQRVIMKRDIFTADIYYYIFTEFDYAIRDSRLTAYGGVVL